jgi:hypothetical protein
MSAHEERHSGEGLSRQHRKRLPTPCVARKVEARPHSGGGLLIQKVQRNSDQHTDRMRSRQTAPQTKLVGGSSMVAPPIEVKVLRTTLLEAATLILSCLSRGDMHQSDDLLMPAAEDPGSHEFHRRASPTHGEDR